jgi:hypothetical protein
VWLQSLLEREAIVQPAMDSPRRQGSGIETVVT